MVSGVGLDIWLPLLVPLRIKVNIKTPLKSGPIFFVQAAKINVTQIRGDECLRSATFHLKQNLNKNQKTNRSL